MSLTPQGRVKEVHRRLGYPDRTGPDRTRPDRTGPGRTGPGRTGPGGTGPGRTGAGRTRPVTGNIKNLMNNNKFQ